MTHVGVGMGMGVAVAVAVSWKRDKVTKLSVSLQQLPPHEAAAAAPNLAHALPRNRISGSNYHVPAPDNHPNTLEKHLHLQIFNRWAMPMKPRGNHHLQERFFSNFPTQHHHPCRRQLVTPQPRTRVPPTNTYDQGKGELRLNPTRTPHRIRISDATPTPAARRTKSAAGSGAPIRGVPPRIRGITTPETAPHERNRTGVGRARTG
jgi:hypothetical protein